MSVLVQFVCAVAECLCWYGLCMLLLNISAGMVCVYYCLMSSVGMVCVGCCET